MLHIYRNTPFGRETLLQSATFAQGMDIDLVVYIPREKKFLMYFEHEAVQVDLDDSYLVSPETAKSRVEEILAPLGLAAQFFESSEYTGSNLPDVPTDFEYMCCPRSISDLSSKIGLGYIGSKVRAILKSARFPVLIPCPVFKQWHSVTVLFGGSEHSLRAMRLGLSVSQRTGMPLDIITQSKGMERSEYEAILEENDLVEPINRCLRQWLLFTGGRIEDNLYDVAHDSLVVLGAYGHSAIKTLLFGSTMETVQSTLPNNLLIVGPEYRPAL